MSAGGESPVQEDLFGEADSGISPEPVLMALHSEYYELIWQGLKTHEFRRRFLAGRAARWFVYLNAPASRLAAVIDLGPAVVAVPEQVAAIAERARAGVCAAELASADAGDLREGRGSDPDPGDAGAAIRQARVKVACSAIRSDVAGSIAGWRTAMPRGPAAELCAPPPPRPAPPARRPSPPRAGREPVPVGTALSRSCCALRILRRELGIPAAGSEHRAA
jgi:hypothetical protein